MGTFAYRHIHRRLFWGYREVQMESRQNCFIALPEKALLDLFYLTPGPVTEPFLDELRLEPWEGLDSERLMSFARRTGRGKLIRAAALAARMLRAHGEEEEERL